MSSLINNAACLESGHARFNYSEYPLND